MRDAAKITADDYKRAFLALDSAGKITENQLAMLKTHCHAPEQVITARELAKAVGYKEYRGANIQYGTLAKRIAKEVGYQPRQGYTFLSTLVEFEKVSTPYPMKLRPNAVKALKQIGWV